MAQFCVEIPDDKVDEVLNAIGSQYQYQATLPNPDFDVLLPVDAETNPKTIINPENIAQFVNRKTREWLIENVKAYNAKVAVIAARQSAIDAVNFDITDPQL